MHFYIINVLLKTQLPSMVMYNWLTNRKTSLNLNFPHVLFFSYLVFPPFLYYLPQNKKSMQVLTCD